MGYFRKFKFSKIHKQITHSQAKTLRPPVRYSFQKRSSYRTWGANTNWTEQCVNTRRFIREGLISRNEILPIANLDIPTVPTALEYRDGKVGRVSKVSKLQ
jgi:hypothetical protein